MKTGNPFWFDGVMGKNYPALADDLSVDVAIVGGGIVGLQCAHRLAGTGLKVILLEARRIGRQATGRSTAKVTSQHGQRYGRLTTKFGEEHARTYARVNQEAIGEIVALAQEMEAQAGLEQQPAYIYATDEAQAKQLEEEYKAAKALGLPAEIASDAGLPFPTTALHATVPLDSITPGEGGIIAQDGEQLAVYRHENGTLTAHSATCTHMGCIVGWNGIDRTWDCPCHGSRFDERGEVIAGPAVSPVESRDLEDGGS